MAGYTHLPFRKICRRAGAALTYTEMVPAQAIARQIPKSMQYLESHPKERPVIAHIYGTDPQAFAKAAGTIEKLQHFVGIDINTGCPAPKIIRKGAGVRLMRQPDLVRDIIKALRDHCDLPITIKTRMGIDASQPLIDSIAEAAVEAGATALTLHARFAKERHGGDADWDSIKRLSKELPIPVIGNGGINRAADVPRMLEYCNCDAVMIGRAALGNPWIFSEANALLSGRTCVPPGTEEKKAIILEHLDGLTAMAREDQKRRKNCKVPPEEAAARIMRGFLPHYFSGLAGLRTTMLALVPDCNQTQLCQTIDALLRL